MVSLRLALRLIGFLSLTITARVLTPEDFGVFGTASLIAGLFVILGNFGFGDSVMRLRSDDQERIHTIWTIRLFICLTITSCILVSSGPASEFLNDPRAGDLLLVLALVPTLDALCSPASAIFIRQFGFRQIIYLKLAQRVAQVSAVIALAIILRSYWALAIGSVVGSAMGIVITQIAKPYRPCLSLKYARELGFFAFWTFVRNFGVFLVEKSDEFVVRKIAPTELFALYHVSRDLTRSLVVETVAPARDALLPAFARLANFPERFARAITISVGSAMILAVPIGLGVSATAKEIILIVLGSQWNDAAPFLAYTAFGVACNTVGVVSNSVFVAVNRQHLAAILSMARALTFFAGSVAVGLLYGPLAIAAAFSVMAAGHLMLNLFVIWRVAGIKTRLIDMLYRPLLAGGGMIGLIHLLPIDERTPVIVSALLKVGVGGISYSLLLLLLWRLAGKPSGPETALIQTFLSLASAFLIKAKVMGRRGAGPTQS